MKVFAIWFALSMVACAATAQNGVLILKKANGKQIDKFFKGKHLDFFTKEGMPVGGTVEGITADSVYLVFYATQKRMTQLGVPMTDTTGFYRIGYALSNIGSFPADRGGRLLPTAMLLGGLGYMVVNIFNTTRQGEPPFGKENLDNVGWGLGTAAVGYAWLSLKRKRYTIGNTYKLVVIE